MRTVMVFSYLARHLKKIMPVVQALANDASLRTLLVVMTREEYDYARQMRVSCRMLDDYTDVKRVRDFDLEWGLEPLITALAKEKPDLFIAAEVNLILRNAVHYCRQNGIPTLLLQHGTPTKHSLHAFVPFEGDCFAAWGDCARDYLMRHGVDGRKIAVTGGANFDLTAQLRPDRAAIFRALGADPGLKLIVFTTQGCGAGNCPSGEEIRSGIEETVRAAAGDSRVFLYLQVHPAQDTADVQSIVDRCGPLKNVLVGKYADTESLMAVADGVITFFSTTAIDALILNKPLMLINLSDDKDFYPFAGMKAAIGVYTKRGIASGFARLVDDNRSMAAARAKAVEYVTYKVDGKSCARILGVAKGML